MDITHYNGGHFLTLIDCGPSFHQLDSFFYKQHPLTEILTDNDIVFTCKHFKKFLKDWGVQLWFQCANALAGNSIVEKESQKY